MVDSFVSVIQYLMVHTAWLHSLTIWMPREARGSGGRGAPRCHEREAGGQTQDETAIKSTNYISCTHAHPSSS